MSVHHSLHMPPRIISYLRFVRKTWRKARETFKKDESWPFWVQSEPHVLELFEIMTPFADDDVSKAWGTEPQLNHVSLGQTQICHSAQKTLHAHVFQITLLRIQRNVHRPCSQTVKVPNLKFFRSGQLFSLRCLAA